ncbi:imm11 family protein [Archangium lansingense]|uniref:imm11 family protein n=1 Tax=Archangium lansingense TaxID=2995310 RepID=UPI003B7D759C
MSKRYFKLNDDVYIPGRWDLDTPIDAHGRKLNDWLFKKGEPVPVEGRLRIPIRAGNGMVLDFTEAGIAVPVVSARAASIFAEMAPGDMQLIPVDVEAHPEPFYILVCTHVVKCIDDEKSGEVQYWKPEDGRPEMTGTYRAVHMMRIDPTKVGDAQVFRPWGYEVVLIVSEDIKQALERVGATGTRFTEVTGPAVSTPEERARSRKSRELLETAATAREAAWRTLGSLDKEVFMPIAMSGSWPGQRQLWGVIRREAGRTLLVTHGLSDPFIERLEPSVGFGLELALEVDAAVKDISKGWPLMLLDRVADEVAEHERVRESVKSGLFSMEVSGKGMPKSLVTEEGRVAVLLGVESRTLPSHFSTPYGEVKLVTVKALLPSELAYLLEHGADGQAELARRFVEGGEEHLSRLRRM